MDLLAFKEQIQNITDVAGGFASEAARAALHAYFPDEFEYYSISLELLNSRGEIKNMLIFPVMPNQISETAISLINIRKTNASVVTFTNTTFNPRTISIQGTFGRKIRLLIGNNQIDSQFNLPLNISNSPELSASIKTGYGVTKLLEKMVRLSQTVDEYGQPYSLYFYNNALNNNYLVEVLDLTFSQSLENNAMWNYNLNLKAIAYADTVDIRTEEEKRKDLVQRLGFNVINNSVNGILSNLTSMNQLQRKIFNTFKLS